MYVGKYQRLLGNVSGYYTYIHYLVAKALCEYWVGNSQKVKLEIKKWTDFGGFESVELRVEEKVKIPIHFYMWFLECSQKYRRVIKLLYFICSLQQYLAKFS
jgi:hypothetical protein